MALAAGCGVQRPGRVAQRELEFGCVLGLRLQPPADVGCERELVEPAAEAHGEVALDRSRVESRRLGRLDPAAGAPLHELPLDRVQRRELVVAPVERA